MRALAATVALALVGCGGLPVDVARTPSVSISDGADTPLGRAIAAQARDAPAGTAGVRALVDGREAWAARVLAVRAATRAIDVQVYLWHDDATGWLLLDEVRRAADRGVRVRLLIDDNGVDGLDPVLALLDAHPDLEVRLFNPFPQRGWLRPLGFLTDFARLNRRMHNKAFVADAQLAIVGGRNVGDVYFAAGQGSTYADLDLMVVGEPVRAVSEAFDRYWNAVPAYPAAAVLADVEPLAPAAFGARIAALAATAAAAQYAEAVASTRLVHEVLDGSVRWEWARARLVVDDPAKVLAPPGTRELQMMPQLAEAMGEPRRTLDLVSPYFVPGEDGAAALVALAGRGVRVRVLTNSLAATDVAAVHAGYARRRGTLLAGGVELLELRPGVEPNEDTVPTTRPGGSGGGSGGAIGSSGSLDVASLHAKTFAADGERIFVGSFNLEPRSAGLNTEMGLVVESAALARALIERLDGLHPAAAWKVALDARGELVWDDGSGTPLRGEPQAGAWRRLVARVLAWLPIEGLL